jgi:hypothetical protein
MIRRTDELTARLQALMADLRGDPIYGKYEEPAPPSIRERVSNIVGSQWRVTSPPTRVQRDGYNHAADAFEKTLADLRALVERDLKELESTLERIEAPWTPGRIPVWKKEADESAS